MHLSKAKIPEKFVIETFPFGRQSKLKKKRIFDLYDSLEYMSKKQNIIWIGPTGTGKTGLASSFLMQAIDKGYKGRFIVFPELIDILYKSVGDHSETAVVDKFSVV